MLPLAIVDIAAVRGQADAPAVAVVAAVAPLEAGAVVLLRGGQHSALDRAAGPDAGRVFVAERFDRVALGLVVAFSTAEEGRVLFDDGEELGRAGPGEREGGSQESRLGQEYHGDADREILSV